MGTFSIVKVQTKLLKWVIFRLSNGYFFGCQTQPSVSDIVTKMLLSILLADGDELSLYD